MKPLGCPVTILNTLDHLGKFEGKADEGFLVGYSINRRGPEWLFDIDSLTNSMNYKPVTAENQTNNGAGIEINANVRKAGQEKASDHEYILLPFMPSSTQSSNDKDAGEVPDKEDEGVSKGSSIDDQEKTDINTQDVDTAEPVLILPVQVLILKQEDKRGIVVRNKERLVAQGYTQEEGTDYDKAFSHVARIEAIRIFLAYASFMGFIVYQMDVKSTFLYGTIEEEVYVYQPPGFEDLHFPNKVYKVEKALYGLHQAPEANKKDKRGIVVRNKERLVAQGYAQEEGIDYDEVFAPIAKIKSIRLFLAYASYKDFVVYQMDVKSAFLYGRIEEEDYVCRPPGFKDPEFPDKVSKVEKALYGLHHAPRAWYETFTTYLLDNGFHRGQINKTLFIKRVKGDILLVQVYVDDIIFSSTRKEMCTEFEKMTHKKFQMSSMGELALFLGLQVT
nr:putative ribonuclease H-like domain-containing protein [Tanacetum cinerariifolium]